MAWAKHRAPATYDLAASNLVGCGIDDLAGACEALSLDGANPDGHPPLVEAIASRYGVAPSRVVVASGCSGANLLAIAASTGPGGEVVMEKPYYDPLLGTCQLVGAEVRCFERRFEDGYQLNLDELRRTLTVVAVLIGVIVGSLAAVIGGKVDELLMRVVDVFMSVPELIFPLAIAAVLGPSFSNIIIALAAVLWAKYARIIRAEILRVRQSSYVEAASAIGDSRFRIYRRDILPNSITPITVQATLEMGHVVLLGATLSFIGLAEAGLAEWGVLVSEGQRGIAAGRWWASTFPGLMIFLWALAFNLVGDGLRDALDPRTED